MQGNALRSVSCTFERRVLSDDEVAVVDAENSRLKSTEFCVVLLGHLIKVARLATQLVVQVKAKKDGCPGPGTEEQPCLHCTINTACDVSSSDARVKSVHFLLIAISNGCDVPVIPVPGCRQSSTLHPSVPKTLATHPSSPPHVSCATWFTCGCQATVDERAQGDHKGRDQGSCGWTH